jgi:Flp pilus assembly protein TadB
VELPADAYLTQNTAAAILVGAMVGGGLVLTVAALIGWRAKPKSPNRATAVILRRLGRRGIIALLMGVVVGVASGWVVLGLGAVALIMFWDELFGGAGSERLAVRRVEALALWTESLRDTIAGAVGLEQAIPASARGADPVLRVHLNALLDRLRGRMPMPEALQMLADDLDDAAADLVIAALILNSKLRGPGLRDVLSALAASAREEVEVRQRVIASRAGTRRSVQIIVAVVVVFMLGMALFNSSFVAPYSTFLGEVVLVIVIGLFAIGFFWLRRLAKVETPARFLVGSGTAAGSRSAADQAAARAAHPGATELMAPAGSPPYTRRGGR